MDPKYILVPRDLRQTAREIVYPSWNPADNKHTENLLQGSAEDVIVVPEWTDVNDWAAACDPRLAPAIYIGERFGLTPEIFVSGDPLSPAMFTNDEARLKVRFFCSVFVADYRPGSVRVPGLTKISGVSPEPLPEVEIPGAIRGSQTAATLTSVHSRDHNHIFRRALRLGFVCLLSAGFQLG